MVQMCMLLTARLAPPPQPPQLTPNTLALPLQPPSNLSEPCLAASLLSHLANTPRIPSVAPARPTPRSHGGTLSTTQTHPLASPPPPPPPRVSLPLPASICLKTGDNVTTSHAVGIQNSTRHRCFHLPPLSCSCAPFHHVLSYCHADLPSAA